MSKISIIQHNNICNTSITDSSDDETSRVATTKEKKAMPSNINSAEVNDFENEADTKFEYKDVSHINIRNLLKLFIVINITHFL